MRINYIILRLVRHFMPEAIARFLLKQRWIIRPGLESSDPFAAVDQYLKGLSQHGDSIAGKRILVFGYGGRFAVGVELLKRGAAHVVLCDHFVLLDRERNLALLPEYAEYLFIDANEVKPRPEYITLLHGDIREMARQGEIAPVDLVLSISVFEHLDDVDGITHALANLTVPQGSQLHYVDLRDHYFKYPFEMLAYSKSIWQTLLNPTSNLNRLRLWEYRKIFESCFQKVDILITARQDAEFEAARGRIRPEYVSGNLLEDAATLICVHVQRPVH
jgi:hypothetical protein